MLAAIKIANFLRMRKCGAQNAGERNNRLPRAFGGLYLPFASLCSTPGVLEPYTGLCPSAAACSQGCHLDDVVQEGDGLTDCGVRVSAQPKQGIEGLGKVGHEVVAGKLGDVVQGLAGVIAHT